MVVGLKEWLYLPAEFSGLRFAFTSPDEISALNTDERGANASKGIETEECDCWSDKSILD
ncbi:hypothetical protein BBBOND_0402980 [Babesia bigemina]|uniref:Uncharacterized protein n=1 Tax=Babesia bigemina TaxID=5866 RepID=A0A061DES9_BABBI|nr:hypothetical protein BBBOND_0402980 [Babesia bigemina]CDR97810.1 hypothetical protein BBBOND_0402980 [Babesia bigemina]|eukprot:XP_012769996.1 hypothetical protein BBBOND_0402980 [Babesia bigemina]